jgi:nitrite reductase/ring-hydroxylating ferredoxin subunit
MNRHADIDPRYPAFTNGWFQVAWSRELAPGALRTLRYFGQELVLFRAMNGTAHVVDAHCPHLGAHLGIGGKVVGDCLECPFHGWQFAGDGRCAHIPYAKKIPPKATLGSWPVVERDGMIFVWRHHARRPPDRELPSVDGFVASAWSGWSTYTLTLRARSLDILENSVDSPHFSHVHGNGPTQPEVVRSGAVLELKQRTSAKLLGVSVGATLHYQLIEPGFHYLHVNGLPTGSALVVSSLIPIDESNVVNRLSIALQRRGGGLVGQAISRLLCMAIARQMIATYEQDRPIWENKIFLAQPALCAGDGPLPLLRKWYAGHAPAAAESSPTSGHDLVRLGARPAQAS